MKDQNTSGRGTSQDRARVAGGQDWEINYMVNKFNVTADEVMQAVIKVGNSREKVEDYLSGKN